MKKLIVVFLGLSLASIFCGQAFAQEMSGQSNDYRQQMQQLRQQMKQEMVKIKQLREQMKALREEMKQDMGEAQGGQRMGPGGGEGMGPRWRRRCWAWRRDRACVKVVCVKVAGRGMGPGAQ